LVQQIAPRRRKVRVLATLGPSSNTPETIRRLFLAGADAFRINMSHGAHADKAALIAAIRGLEKEFGRPSTILFDLQGPKLRVGQFADSVISLHAGAAFTLDRDPTPGTANRVNLPHREIFEALEPGARLLLDDGKLVLRVIKAGVESIETRVEVGGPLSNNKGLNVPDVVVPMAALTEKDRADLAFALEQGADWIALSFVQRPEDVAVMVARGDLGVELPPEQVPPLQKRIVEAARRAGRPVVVATQMLESMIKAPTPTRAEVSDVATAIYDGADAVMLSAESAAGDWPEEAVTMMDRIAVAIEAGPGYQERLHFTETDPDPTTADALSEAAGQIARTVSAKAIICFTLSGSTARRITRERPDAPVLVLTPKIATARRMGLLWGSHAVRTRDVASFEEMVGKAKRMALRNGIAGAGDSVIIMAGVPFGTPGSTNVLHVVRLTGNELRDHEG
jgi:pyruvate kinase